MIFNDSDIIDGFEVQLMLMSDIDSSVLSLPMFLGCLILHVDENPMCKIKLNSLANLLFRPWVYWKAQPTYQRYLPLNRQC